MKRLKRHAFVFLLSSLVGVFNSVHANSATEKVSSDLLSDYANKRTIDTATASAAQGMYRLALPLDVYRGLAHADLRDVRVFNAKGERVPIALINDTASPAAAATASITTALPFFPVTEEDSQTIGTTTANKSNVANTSLTVKLQTDGTLISLNTTAGDKKITRRITSYLVDASRLKTPINALNLDWEKNPTAQTGRVTVEGSNDLNSWRTIAVSQPLIDMAFNGEQLAQKKIEFAPTADKYLRLTWAAAAFTLTKLDAESVSKPTERPAETVKVVGVAGKTDGTYEFTLDARLPITRVRLLLPDANTLAPTRLAIKSNTTQRGTDGKFQNVPSWQQVANATFYRLTRDNVELVSPPTSLSTNVTGATHWQANIDPRSGGIGSSMPTLEVTWSPQQIVFTARGEPPFTLAFGRADAKPTQFQIRDLMPGYEPAAENQLPLAKLTAVTNQAVVTAPAATVAKTTDWKKIILWAVLIIGVALMAWMAIRLGRSPNAADGDKT
jgi:Protein of unknown function (DUF3999)